MSDGSSSEEETWIQWFCSLEGNEFFCEVDARYIEDNFNLYGLRQTVANYREALGIILDTVPSDSEDEEYSARLYRPAVDLYGLVHQRFLLTARGLDMMAEKFIEKDFGTCPLYTCGGQAVLPVGLSDKPRVDEVKVFCPKCQQVFHPPPTMINQYIDGAYFGTTFPHLLLMTHPDLVPQAVRSSYVPRIFGFKIHPTAECVRRLRLPVQGGAPEPAEALPAEDDAGVSRKRAAVDA